MSQKSTRGIKDMQVPGRRLLLRNGIALAGAHAALAGCADPPSRAERSHFVLIHGAWHGAWCWNKVAPLLRAQGHAVTAIDLPGRWYAPASMGRITADEFVDSVGQVLTTSEKPVVLVGHSLGGATISLVAEKYTERIKRLVYLTAFLVPAGQTVGSIGSMDKRTLIPISVRRDPITGTSTVIPSAAKELFYQDCSDDDIRMALQLLSPEPVVMALAPMKLTTGRFGRVERVYIECLQDHAISIEIQRSMQSALPCRQVLQLDSSHSPFISQPEKLAKHLLDLA